MKELPLFELINLLPENSVLWKASCGCIFYMTPNDFIDQRIYSEQAANEPFRDFIERTIERLVFDEEQDSNSCKVIVVDLAIIKAKYHFPELDTEELSRIVSSKAVDIISKNTPIRDRKAVIDWVDNEIVKYKRSIMIPSPKPSNCCKKRNCSK